MPARGLLGLSGAAYRLAMRILGSPEDAEDTVQQAYVAALERLRSGSPPLEERTWFLGAVANLARLHRRRQSRRRKKEVAMRRSHADASPRGTDLVTALGGAMAMLDEKYRLPVSLCYEEELTQSEAAAILKLPESTISDHVKIGLEKLRRALARAGYAALPAAVLGGLKQTAPFVPASLTSRVEALVAEAAAARPSSAARRLAARRRAAKGGFAMKLVAGIVLAGAVAAGVAVSTAGRRDGPLASPPSGPPRHEYVASINTYSYLGDDIDGPAKEATNFRGGSPDAEGNLWGGRWLRSSDGRVLRLSAYEYGTLGLDLKEGPLAGRPVKFVGSDYGWWCGGSAMVGRPDAGGKTDGIYESMGREGKLLRIWKNKDEGGRWWFARAAGGGAAAAPRTKGQSADALAVKFGWLNEPQVGLDNKLRFLADNCFYLLEDGKVTCVLSPDDYKPATEAMKGALPNQGYVGGDGTFYLGYYYVSGEAYKGQKAGVWRVTPDGKVEPWAKSNGHGAGDGHALKQAGWFCGPHIGHYSVCRFIPPGAMLTTAHDEDLVRRIQNGRVATLRTDGQWQEFPGKGWKGALQACGMIIGPNGTIYHTYRDWVDQRLYRYTGIDFDAPVASRRDG